jgi:protein O-mannosyl-transferase
MEKGRIVSPGFLISIILIVVILVTYWPVQKYDFINFDDNEYVNDNPHVKNGLTKENVIWAFTKSHSSNWHPVTWISHMVDCELFGVSAGGHHLTNLYIHIANALLLFFLLKLMTNAVWRSALVAALFALHPLHVESVAWIAERKDVLSTFFLFLTMTAYRHYALRPRPTAFVRVALWYVLGLMTKPMLVTLPVLLLILDYWPLGRLGSATAPDEKSAGLKNLRREPFVSLIMEKIPLFGLSAVVCVATIFVQSSFKSISTLSLGVRIPNALLSYVNYLISTVVPSNLAVFYPFPNAIPWSKTVLALLFLSFASIGIMRMQKKHPWLIAGWLWYVCSLLPIIGIVQVGAQARADRYTYVPLIGIFIIVVWGASEIVHKIGHRKMVTGPLVIGCLVCCSVLTRMQLHHWRNSVTLFSHAFSVTTVNTMTCNNLGHAFLNGGQLDSAAYYLDMSVHIRPYFGTFVNLGTVCAKKNDFRKAAFYFDKAIELDSTHEEVYESLGFAHQLAGNDSAAMACFKKAISINSRVENANYGAGMVFLKNKNLDSAEGFFKKEIEINPRFWQPYNELGLLYAQKKEFQRAFVFFMDAILRCKDSSGITFCNLAQLLLKKGKFNSAKGFYTRSIRCEPSLASGYYGRGLVFFLQDNLDSSLTDFQTALRLKPDMPAAKDYICRIFYRKGVLDSAKVYLTKAREQPGHKKHIKKAADIF